MAIPRRTRYVTKTRGTRRLGIMPAANALRNIVGVARKAGQFVRGIRATRMAFRNRFSRTRTRTKFSKNAKGTKIGTGQWTSKAIYGRFKKPPKFMRMKDETYNYNDYQTERINCGWGRQAIGGLAATAYNLQDLQTITGAGTTVNDSSKKTYLKSANFRILATNTSNQNAKVIVYNVIAKTDCQTTFTPIRDWNVGYARQGSTAGTDLQWGATPYDSSTFTQNWKIWKTTTYYLAQGESFLHNTYINPNRFLNNAKVANMTGGTSLVTPAGGIRGLTQWAMVVLQPFPIHESATRTTITTADSSLDVVYIRRFQNYETSLQSKLIQYGNVLTSTMVNPQQMNEDTGVMTTNID